MDKEIKKIKNIYLKTKVPDQLLNEGFVDVLKRIENSKRPFYFSRIFVSSALVLIMISAISGLTYAAVPHTIFYPVKIAAQNTISSITSISPNKIGQTTKQIVEPKKAKVTPTPTITPTPAKENPEINISQPKNNSEKINNNLQNELPQEIKDASTTHKEEIINLNNFDNINGNSQEKNESSFHLNKSSSNNKKN